jgi:hypothetical protein
MLKNPTVSKYAALFTVATFVALSGCSTTYSTIREDRKLARFQVSNEDPGATIYVNNKPQARTPGYVSMAYTQRERAINPGKYRTGKALLITGLVGLAAGVAMTIGGAAAIPDSDGNGGNDTVAYLGLGLGPVGAIYGLIGAGLGGYMMGSTPDYPNEVETSPSTMVIGLKERDGAILEASIANVDPQDKLPTFDGVRQVHYSAAQGRWTAPTLPVTLKLVDKRPRRRARPLRRPRTVSSFHGQLPPGVAQPATAVTW